MISQPRRHLAAAALPALLGALCLLVAAPATAQEQTGPVCRLSGVVSDSAGEPLQGATVTLVPGDLRRLTDETGSFCFDDLEPGAYQVLVQIAGFSRVAVADVPADGPPQRLRLQLGAEMRENIVVTATGTRKGLDDVAVRTQVVDRDLIENVSARTLADALEFTTGVRVESNCQNCNFSQIRLLGLQGPYTQILMDGQPVISSLAQVYGVEQIPARMIERIEVVKGGGSALYGPGSVGGVVNVISREPARGGGTLSTGIELMDDMPSSSTSGAWDWVSGNRKSYLTAYGQLDRIRPYDVDGDGFSEVSRRSMEALGARFNRYLLDRDAKLTVDVNRIHEYRRGGDRLDVPPHEALVAEEIDTSRYGASVSWMHGVSRTFDYDVTASMSSTARDSYYGTFMDPDAYGTTDSFLGIVDAQFNHFMGRRHVLSWGAQYSSESIDDRQPSYGRLIDETYENAGLFVQHDFAFAEGWQLLSGVRVDKHSAIDEAVLSPRLALMASPRPDVAIRASVATGFRAPQAFDEDLHLSAVGGESRLIFLSPDLTEERSTNVMLGAEWKPELGAGQALLEVNGFHTRLTDLFHNVEADDPATGAFEFRKVNLGAARVYGVEVNVGWGIGDDLVFQGGLVAQRARFDRPEPDFGSRDFFRTPELYGNLSATWNNPVVDLFVGARYTGPMVAPHYAGFVAEDRLETTPSFVTVDAFLSRPVEAAGQRWIVTLGARNLTNAFQEDLDRGPLRDASYVYGPRFPRSIRLGLELRL